VADTVEQARRALELLPDAEHFWRAGAGLLLGLALWTSGDLDAAQPTHSAGVASLEMAGVATLALSAAGDGAELLKARGRLSEARRVYQRSLRLASEYGDAALAVTANLYLGLSELYCEQDDLEAASGYLRRSEALGQQAALPETPYRLRMAQARLRQAHGDLDGALDLLDQAGRLYVRGPLPNVRPVTALKARLWIAQGRLGAATDWAAEQRLSVDDELDYPREFHHITLAKVLVARGGRDCDDGCLDAAGGLLVRLLDAADAGGRTGSSIEILVLQALGYRARGKLGAARRALERALGLAEPEGYIRVFVDEGTPMGDLLRGAVADGVGGAFARRLLAGLDGRLAGEAGPRHPETVSASLLAFPFAPVPPVDSLAEPLTVRELEVLRLVAAGMRNQTIAEHLVISLATVKRHIANAYGKLGVDHRTAAVVRATELRLLS
jgi:ATP/maltotriose-dependent transcriptional regulator MalT